ncbi:Zinc finger protein 595 [Araneus ventricosus]|uniref:Zinc finger protein 595 n=1 Tax=Araneus ventricosus TaxID=182803 RepID=A0A4Y2T249_ARAVE|nr:Zinc finger protein 595 [Araneus ventricosus]
MAELACFNCFTTYNSLIGHYCLNGWWIPGVANENATAQVVVEELDSLKQESTQGPRVQVHATASEDTELVTTNPEFYDENYSSNQVTYGNDQPTYSSQDYTTGGATNQLMAMNSEQNHVEQCAISDLNNPVLFRTYEQGTNDCNMAMRFSFPNNEMPSNIDRLTSMVCQLGLDEDNLNIPLTPNSSNNTTDFATVSGSINNLKMYEFPTQVAFEDIQTRTKIENDLSKFMSNLVEGDEASEMSNESRIINEERGRIKHQLIMGNEFTTEITVDSIQLAEMYHQFSRHGPNNERILVKGELDNLTNNFAVREADPCRLLMLRNIDKVHNKNESSLHAGSINDEGFYAQKYDSFEDCHVDASHALAGPSFSQLNERNISVSLKKFQSDGNLKRHSVVNSGGKQFICNVCQKLFKQKSHLKTHLFIHEEIKPYRCSICGKSFTRKNTLQRHGLVHTGKKPFTCELCSKGFKKKQDLKRHMSIHTGEKLYSCEVCGKAFTRKDSLNEHAHIHMDDNPFECKLCGKKFSAKRSLNRHKKTHKPE